MKGKIWVRLLVSTQVYNCFATRKMVKWRVGEGKIQIELLQESEKGQIFYWSIQTCTRIRLLFDWPSTTKYQSIFNTVPYWPSTIICKPVPPSTYPVPPITNCCRLLLTKCHHISTSTAPYWPSINQNQPILLLLGDYRLLHSLPWVLFNCTNS